MNEYDSNCFTRSEVGHRRVSACTGDSGGAPGEMRSVAGTKAAV
jgi:hypothetical protein